jgi:flavodoxin I
MSTGLYFATIGGNTKRCAELIAEAAGIEKFCEIEDLPNTDELLAHDSLIIGAPTWNTGADKQRSMTGWDEWLYNVLPNLDLKGKKVAFFGMGDQIGYPFNYCDAVGELYDQFEQRGCEVTFGRTSMDGYRFVNSKAQVEGKEETLYGLLFDEDNQNDLSQGRAQEWVGQLKEEGFM